MKLIKTESGYVQVAYTLESINRLQIDYLAYSYLYYHCEISLITDGLYDQICGWLWRHKEVNTIDFQNSDYYKICKDLGSEGSAFDLKEEDYPIKIKQICVRLLKQSEKEIPDKLKEFE
ncbi:DNA ligase LigA-related protein [Metabacillus fastidiosus]|uniref:DNA ligase LigA-related protein n=1 Tax=Metabacillus fastidiosus TaxID=1458 RepID=UPI003D27B62E